MNTQTTTARSAAVTDADVKVANRILAIDDSSNGVLALLEWHAALIAQRRGAESVSIEARGEEIVKCYGTSPGGTDAFCVHSAQDILEMSREVMIRSCQNSLPMSILSSPTPHSVPLPEDWRQAIRDWCADPVAGTTELDGNLDWIEQRVRSLAKGERK